jgi:hypothetical protein
MSGCCITNLNLSSATAIYLSLVDGRESREGSIRRSFERGAVTQSVAVLGALLTSEDVFEVLEGFSRHEVLKMLTLRIEYSELLSDSRYAPILLFIYTTSMFSGSDLVGSILGS